MRNRHSRCRVGEAGVVVPSWTWLKLCVEWNHMVLHLWNLEELLGRVCRMRRMHSRRGKRSPRRGSQAVSTDRSQGTVGFRDLFLTWYLFSARKCRCPVCFWTLVSFHLSVPRAALSILRCVTSLFHWVWLLKVDLSLLHNGIEFSIAGET